MALPYLNGLDVQKRVVDRTDLPIIFIMGYGDLAMDGPGYESGRGPALLACQCSPDSRRSAGEISEV